jgi:uncharacterized membrane protein YkoI
MQTFDRLAISLAVALFIAGTQAVLADPAELRGPGDHDRARLSFQQGHIRSLDQLLKELGPGFGGEIVEVELMKTNGAYFFQFRVLAPDGRIGVYSVDAATGKILKGK